MTRRSFLNIGIGSIIVSLWGKYFLSFKGVVREILLEDIHKLNLGAEEVELFMREADKESFWTQFGQTRRIFTCIQHLLYPLIRLPYIEKYFEVRNAVTGQFLLSTTLFFRSYKPGREIEYIGFHNPYQRGCSNPFSRGTILSVT